ncbi:MAG: CPXCG motif-containing cysteine-rich protein [Verrucomicrobiota bacterium]|nr:CPXCG motif-containing cysteine-rich protein [Verrucomicrobiota bacterium]
MPALQISCPFCGEPFTIQLDETVGNQSLITDCETCCRPIMVTANIANDSIQWHNVESE